MNQQEKYVQDTLAKIAGLGLVLAVSFALYAGVTCTLQWAIESIWHFEVSFWPLFGLVTVLGFMTGPKGSK